MSSSSLGRVAHPHPRRLVPRSLLLGCIVVAALLVVLAVPLAIRQSLRKKMASPSTKPRVLVTGGAGYIGSHTVVALVTAGYPVVIVDSLINSSEEAVRRVRKLVPHPEWIDFVKVCCGGALAMGTEGLK